MNKFFLPALVLACFLSHAAAEDPLALKIGELEPLPKELHAFNTNLLTDTAFQGIDYSSPEFGKGLTDLRPGGLRFPGGSIANNYLWKEDSFSLQKDDKTKWAAQQLELFRKIGKPYDLPGFAQICREHEMSPIWVLNIYEETPESVLELFDRFDELGLEVKAVELGNEPYWDPRSLMNVWKYMDYCRPLAAVIRTHHPDVKIGACFGPMRADQTYAKKWNAPLAKENWYDALVYHEYYGGQGFALEKGVELPLEAVLHPEALIDEAVDHLAEIAPGKPLWFTEWNIGQKGLDQWKNTGSELLFLGAMTTRILDHRETVEWSCFHQIIGGKFGTFFYDKDQGRMVTLPSYEFYRMLGAAWDGATGFRAIETGDETLLGFATEADDAPRIVLTHRGAEPRIVQVPEGLTALTIAVDPAEPLPFDAGLARPLPIIDGTATLPPHSISLIAPETVCVAATRVEWDETPLAFPARPHLTLWHKPFARQAPRVAADGSYTVDFAKFADKGQVVIKLNLSGFAPEAGARYALSFDAKTSEGIGFVAKLPDAEKAEGTWTQLTPQGSELRYEFVYDPEVNQGELSFLFADGALAKAATMEWRDFRLVQLTGESEP